MSDFDAKTFLQTLTQKPGVYQMLDDKGQVLYVGKAKNLRKRVSSYFRKTGLSIKNQSLVSKLVDVQVTATASETEALLLEHNLIKSLKPPYNILLRDDKSYPYIFLTEKHTFPALGLHRGTKKKGVRYFGPFPSAWSVRETLNLLQKTFRVRQCDEHYFKNRSRPCLQYQIGRCTGPCVEGTVSHEAYAEDVAHTVMFLEGKGEKLQQDITQQMHDASAATDFERAAQLRDQLIHLRHIQEQQYIESAGGDIDVLAGHIEGSSFCVHCLFIRHGRILGSRTYFPKVKAVSSIDELLTGFISQKYLSQAGTVIPQEIITSEGLEDKSALEEVLCQQAGRKVQIRHQVRKQRAKWIKQAIQNARQNLLSHTSQKLNATARTQDLTSMLGLEQPLKRMECFDISHGSGESTVASCVVFDENGPMKSEYRRFNIKDVTAGDDYAAMAQAIERRYKRIQKDEGTLPDVLLIDGGKGQLRMAEDALAELGVNGIMLIGVAKGATRKPGLEELYIAGQGNPLVLEKDAPALQLIQHIRDEAHRFAITAHRQAQRRKRRTSVLQDIPGIGAKRRRELLNYFGGLQEVSKASEDDLAKVTGISQELAKTIYEHLHPD